MPSALSSALSSERPEDQTPITLFSHRPKDTSGYCLQHIPYQRVRKMSKKNLVCKIIVKMAYEKTRSMTQ